MKKKLLLLPIITMLLTGCAGFDFGGGGFDFGGSSTSNPTSSQGGTTPSSGYSISIKNKEELHAGEFYNGITREINLEVTPETNILYLISNGEISITSDNPNVIVVNGLSLTAMSEGTTTIRASYKGQSDSVQITTAGEKQAPGVIWTTCEGMMNADDTNGTYMYEGWGYLVDWGRKTDTNIYGELGLGDRPETVKGDYDYMYVYGSFVNPGEGKLGFYFDGEKYVKDYNRDFMTNELTANIRIGDRVHFRGIRADYGTTKEAIIQILEVETPESPDCELITLLHDSKLELNIGDHVQLSYKLSPENCTLPVKFDSNNIDIATVNDKGVLRANREGEAKITAVCGNKKDSITVKVNIVENECVLNVDNMNILFNGSYNPEQKYTGNINGVDFQVDSVGNFGDGMQFYKTGDEATRPAGAVQNISMPAKKFGSIIFERSLTRQGYDNLAALEITLSDTIGFENSSTYVIDLPLATYVAFEYGLPEPASYVRITNISPYILYFETITYKFSQEEVEEIPPLQENGLTCQTSYINRDGGADALSIWDEDYVLHDPNGWGVGNGWRLYMVFDAEGDLAYGVVNPANGYGGPAETTYMRDAKMLITQ